MISAYPLQWPDGWPRTLPGARVWGRFTKGERVYSSAPGGSSYVRKREVTVTDGVARVIAELTRMGVDRQDVVISTNVRTRLDGLPRSGEKAPDDPGAAVYWETAARERRVMAIDRYTDVADNLAAIAATLDAMRAIERHGGAQVLERAFTGFTALPAPGSSTHWRDVLQCGNTTDLDSVKRCFRTLASTAHPDKGGSHEAMAELNRALAQAEEELKP